MADTTYSSLDETKAYMGVPVATNDALLTTFEKVARALINKYCSVTTFLEDTYSEFYDGERETYVVLKHFPIVSVTTLHIDGGRVFDASALIASDEFVIYKDDGKIELIGVDQFGGVRSIFPRGQQNIKVVYVAGFSTTPDDLKVATQMVIDHLFNNRGMHGVTSESVGGINQTYDWSMFPQDAQMILDLQYNTGFASRVST